MLLLVFPSFNIVQAKPATVSVSNTQSLPAFKYSIKSEYFEEDFTINYEQQLCRQNYNSHINFEQHYMAN